MRGPRAGCIRLRGLVVEVGAAAGALPGAGIHGMHDEYGTRVHPETIGELSAGPAQVAILPDTFHVPHRERPEAVIELVCGFLDPVRQGGACAHRDLSGRRSSGGGTRPRGSGASHDAMRRDETWTKNADPVRSQRFSNLARPEGFEPPTPWFAARYSIQMSYGRVAEIV